MTASFKNKNKANHIENNCDEFVEQLQETKASGKETQKGVRPEKATLIDAALTATQAWRSTLVGEASGTPEAQSATALVAEEAEDAAPAVQSIRARAMRKQAYTS